MKTFRWNWKSTTLAVVLVLGLASLTIPKGSDGPDELDKAERLAAGSIAIDCGISTSGGDRFGKSKVDSCVVAAFRSKKPFFARYEISQSGATSSVAVSRATVGTAEGQIQFFEYSRNKKFSFWHEEELDQGTCEHPKIYPLATGQGRQNFVLGCADCAPDGTEASGSCVLFD